MRRRRLVWIVVVIAAHVSVRASTPTFPNNWTYRGFYKIVNQGGPIMSSTSSVTFISSGTYAGSWFAVLGRNQKYDIVQFHMPDDTSGYTADTLSQQSGCVNSPSSGNNNNLPANVNNADQKHGCRESIVNDWGKFLCLASQGCTPPAPFTGLDTAQYDSYGLWWEPGAARLYLSFGDFYSCSTNEVLLSMDISGGIGNVKVYGPWILSVAGAQLNCGESQRAFRNAPSAMVSVNTANILAARNTNLATPCANFAACNTSQTVSYPYNGGTSYPVAAVKYMLASGQKQSGTGGVASWGPNLFLCDQPSDTTPKDTLIDCLKLLYWPQPNGGVGDSTIDDLGVTHNNIKQNASRILRRDAFGVMFGHNANGEIPGTPLDAAVPYGRWWSDQTQGIGSSGPTGPYAGEGWAPGIDNSGDVASHWVWIDEGTTNGLIYFGSYAIGYNWYGLGTSYSDDFDQCATYTGSGNTCTSPNPLPPGSQTKFVSWDGINSMHYQPNTVTISAISLSNTSTPCGAIGNVTCITTSTAHGYATGQAVNIGGGTNADVGSRSTPTLTGQYTATVIDSTHFTVPVIVTATGTDGVQFVPGTNTIATATTIAAYLSVSSITAANPTHITTTTNHGYSNGQTVWFNNTNSTPPLSGPYVVTVVDTTHFTVPVNVAQSGNTGFVQISPSSITGRWMQSMSFPAVGDSTQCGVDGTGTRSGTTNTGYNPCRYVYGRRNGGKGYNSEYTVPAVWTFLQSDIINSLTGTYTGPWSGHTNVNSFFTTYNVDQFDFQVLNAPSPDGNYLGLSPVYANAVAPAPSFQYNDNQDNYNEKTPRNYSNFEMYYRPSSGSGGPVSRLYIMNDSNQTGTLLIDVFDLSAGCGDTIPTAPSGLSGTATGANNASLSWTDNSSNETGFTIQNCVGNGCSAFTTSGATPANTTSFVQNGLSASTTYTFRVGATNCAGTAFSSTTILTTPAGTPVGSRIKGITSRRGDQQ